MPKASSFIASIFSEVQKKCEKNNEALLAREGDEKKVVYSGSAGGSGNASGLRRDEHEKKTSKTSRDAPQARSEKREDFVKRSATFEKSAQVGVLLTAARREAHEARGPSDQQTPNTRRVRLVGDYTDVPSGAVLHGTRDECPTPRVEAHEAQVTMDPHKSAHNRVLVEGDCNKGVDGRCTDQQ